jgi:Flp pilus assembly pilin Flp
MITLMIRSLNRLLVDEEGQDLIEYALLSGLVGVAGLLVFSELGDTMGAAYTDWLVEVNEAWEPCPPGGCL